MVRNACDFLSIYEFEKDLADQALLKMHALQMKVKRMLRFK